MLFGPDKFRLGLPFVKRQVNHDDFVLVNRAAIRLSDDDLKELKSDLYTADGDHRSVAFWCVLCVCIFVLYVLRFPFAFWAFAFWEFFGLVRFAGFPGRVLCVLRFRAPCVVCSVRVGAVFLALRLRSGICV